jgi:hypothetical protein
MAVVEVLQPMTDRTQPSVAEQQEERMSSHDEQADRVDTGATSRGGRSGRPRHPARRSRIVAVGIGVAAMAGLVSNMEVSGSRAQAKDPAGSTTGWSNRAEVGHRRSGFRKAVAVAARHPIVLTPHAVVHTVAAPSVAVSGGSGGSGYVAAAPAAAAPVATTSGSTAAP